ncbi:hypothetical protein [Acinetobacter ursingii]|uniref:hypothetical protein n=1 Tax=Acinetobacter ursingii TaxID=108980 RepID=UPI003AF699DA
MQIKEFVKSHPLFCLIVFVIFLWVIYPFLLILFLGTDKAWSDLGTFGDTYGALNTLFSGLAFAVLILSLFLQRKELEAQRIELEAQRHEIKESNAIAEAQRKITEQQATLIEQQISDSKVQAFYQLLFKYLDEKNRKIEHIQHESLLGNRGLKIFSHEILYELKSTFLTIETFRSYEEEILDSTFSELLTTAHNRTNHLILEMEYVEFTNFILRFIEMHEHLGILEHAIKTFISYQTIDEMHCMAYLAYDDEKLTEYIKKYALLRKVNTFEDDELFLAFIERLYGADSYTPQ